MYVIVELSQAERDELTAMLSVASMPPASSSGPRSCWLPTLAAAMRRLLAPYRWEARPLSDQAALRGGQFGTALSEESRLERSASSPARKKPFWWRPPCAKPLLGAPPLGRWSCWPARWSSSPTTRACRTRRSAGAWPKTTSSPGAGRCGAFPGLTANMSPEWKTCSTSMPSARSQEARRLFRREPDPAHGEVAPADPGRAGQLERYDYEYRRNGTVNLFVFLDTNRPWRKVKVTARRTAKDYAQCMRELVDVHYPDADTIRSCRITCRATPPGALYQAFLPAEARASAAA